VLCWNTGFHQNLGKQLMNIETPHAFHAEIDAICDLDWASLSEADFIDAARAYYFFSVQFRENLQTARTLFPDDAKLQHLEQEECDTDNLSPWPGIAEAGEKMNHDEFMARVLRLAPTDAAYERFYTEAGERYLADARALDATTRALSIASYEDGGLERLFRAMLQAPQTSHPAVRAFRHFLAEHIRFDSDPDQGHGALSRHLAPDDRILPLWQGLHRLFVALVPAFNTAS
jgi:predicted transcriptional regulator